MYSFTKATVADSVLGEIDTVQLSDSARANGLGLNLPHSSNANVQPECNTRVAECVFTMRLDYWTSRAPLNSSNSDVDSKFSNCGGAKTQLSLSLQSSVCKVELPFSWLKTSCSKIAPLAQHNRYGQSSSEMRQAFL